MSLYTQYERVPPDVQIAAFRALVKERANHVPVAYLIGKAWFFSLEFAVTREVLIPRPDTETLVEFVIQTARNQPAWPSAASPSGEVTTSSGGIQILDLCTGSGIIAITLAKNLSAVTCTATDISAPAIALAKQNADIHQVAERITFLQGDLLAPLDHMPAPTLFHVIAANPPYIPTADIPGLPPTVRDHEPRLALDGGADGLAFHKQIIAQAKKFLHPSGILILEMQFDQGPALHSLISATGHFHNIRTLRDAAGHPRCILATL